MDQEPTETKTDNDNNNGVNQNSALETKFGNMNIDNELYLRLRSSTWPIAAAEDLLSEPSPDSNEVSNQNNFDDRNTYLTNENDVMITTESQNLNNQQQQHHNHHHHHHQHLENHLNPNQYQYTHQYSLVNRQNQTGSTVSSFENSFHVVMNDGGTLSSEMKQEQHVARINRCDQVPINVCQTTSNTIDQTAATLATNIPNGNDNVAINNAAAAIFAASTAHLATNLLANHTNSHDITDCLPQPPPPPPPPPALPAPLPLLSNSSSDGNSSNAATVATTSSSSCHNQPSVANGYIKKASSRRNAWGNYSYADLITKAISNSAQNRLTLSEIYDWMIRNITYFRDKGDSNSSAGWKNSIRHNLSLHNRFMRVPNEGTGKSSWWMINPDAQPGKAIRRRANTIGTSKVEKRRGRIKKKTSISPNVMPNLCFTPGSTGPNTNSSPVSNASDGSIPYSMSPPFSNSYSLCQGSNLFASLNGARLPPISTISSNSFSPQLAANTTRTSTLNHSSSSSTSTPHSSSDGYGSSNGSSTQKITIDQLNEILANCQRAQKLQQIQSQSQQQLEQQHIDLNDCPNNEPFMNDLNGSDDLRSLPNTNGHYYTYFIEPNELANEDTQYQNNIDQQHHQLTYMNEENNLVMANANNQLSNENDYSQQLQTEYENQMSMIVTTNSGVNGNSGGGSSGSVGTEATLDGNFITINGDLSCDVDAIIENGDLDLEFMEDSQPDITSTQLNEIGEMLEMNENSLRSNDRNQSLQNTYQSIQDEQECEQQQQQQQEEFFCQLQLQQQQQQQQPQPHLNSFSDYHQTIVLNQNSGIISNNSSNVSLNYNLNYNLSSNHPFTNNNYNSSSNSSNSSSSSSSSSGSSNNNSSSSSSSSSSNSSGGNLNNNNQQINLNEIHMKSKNFDHFDHYSCLGNNDQLAHNTNGF